MSTSTNYTNSIIPIPYEEVYATSSMRSVPRFGHENDFSVVFSSNPDQVDDYLYGLAFVGGFVISVFVLWFILLLIWKCIRIFGFASGKRFTNPRRATRVRCIYILALFTWLVFTILLITEGISNLQETIVTVNNSNQEIILVTQEADRIVSSLQSVGQATAGVRTSLINNWSTDFCPNNADIDNAVGVQVSAQAQDAIALLTVLNDFVANPLAEVKSAINTTLEGSFAIDHSIQQIEIHDWQSILVLTLWVIVPCFLLVGVVMAAFGVAHPCFECTISWFFLPLLILITITSMVLAAIMSMVATGNADFCSGGTVSTPDQSVYSILSQIGFSPLDYEYKAVQFYVSQCLSDDPFSFAAGYVSQISDAKVGISTLNDSLFSVGLSTLSSLCGRDFSEIDGLISTMLTNLDTLESNAKATLDLLKCSNIVPIYTSTIYDGTCTYFVRGLTWSFSAFLVIAFMGMIMIMLRSSCLGNAEDDYTKDTAQFGESANNYAYEDDAYGYQYGHREPTETFLTHNYTPEDTNPHNISAITEAYLEGEPAMDGSAYTPYAPSFDDQEQQSYVQNDPFLQPEQQQQYPQDQFQQQQYQRQLDLQQQYLQQQYLLQQEEERQQQFDNAVQGQPYMSAEDIPEDNDELYSGGAATDNMFEAAWGEDPDADYRHGLNASRATAPTLY